MLEVISMPVDSYTFSAFGGGEGVERMVNAAGCQGLELIWGGEPLPEQIPFVGSNGYHMVFFSDWLDLWNENEPELLRKFGTMEQVKRFYGGYGREFLIEYFRRDYERAKAASTRYAVFHVSDVSIEEGYTYRWLHDHRQVIDASAELINCIAPGEQPMDILVENQWWPGFTFTRPDLTERLLDRIQTPRKGIMLDTGHLMNCEPRLQTQRQGVEYILDRIAEHGTLAKSVKGLHLHYSLSGDYVKTHVGTCPADLPQDYIERFGVNYSHILKIDTHRPWTDPHIQRVIEVIEPSYVNHELSAATPQDKLNKVLTQRKALGKI